MCKYEIIIFNFKNIFKFFFPQQRKNNKKVRVTVKPHVLYRVSFLSKNSKLLFCFESTEGTKCFQYISRKKGVDNYIYIFLFSLWNSNMGLFLIGMQNFVSLTVL